MARQNSRQARAAKRRAALNALAKARNWTLQVEEGKVRDSVVSKQHITQYAGPRGLKGAWTAPRFTDADVPAKRGKVRDGKFKPDIPGTKKRFT